jgi:hypothetical protein
MSPGHDTNEESISLDHQRHYPLRAAGHDQVSGESVELGLRSLQEGAEPAMLFAIPASTLIN